MLIINSQFLLSVCFAGRKWPPVCIIFPALDFIAGLGRLHLRQSIQPQSTSTTANFPPGLLRATLDPGNKGHSFLFGFDHPIFLSLLLLLLRWNTVDFFFSLFSFFLLLESLSFSCWVIPPGATQFRPPSIPGFSRRRPKKVFTLFFAFLLPRYWTRYPR